VAGAEELPAAKRQAFVDKGFEELRAGAEFPLTQKNKAIFVFRGAARQVAVAGDMTGWQPSLMMQPVEGTDLFYLEQSYEPEARLDYKLVVDGDWRLDPLNPKTMPGGYGENSELRMPGFRPHPATIAEEALPAGRVTTYTLASEILGQRRTVHLYRPPGYDESARHTVFFFQDGRDYLRLGQAARTLDYLIHHRQLEPVVGIFVDPVERTGEYVMNDAYVEFFVRELLPWVEANVAVRAEAAGRVLIGDSLGGLVCAYLAYKHPEQFGHVLSHSGAFPLAYRDNLELGGQSYRVIPFGRALAEKPLAVKFFLVIGTYERAVGDGMDLVEGNQQFSEDLRANPTVPGVELRLYPQGHSWGLWRDTLPDGLVWLLGSDK